MSRYDPEIVRAVQRVRELLRVHGTKKTAELTGRSPANVSQIKNGQRHKHTGALTINSLQLQRVVSPRLCRRCGNNMLLIARTGLCVQCEIIELNRQGLVIIEEVKE